MAARWTSFGCSAGRSRGRRGRLKTQDFAGGIVIHITSAVSGLVVCRALGPRRGFDPLGEAFPHSNLVLSAIGLGMLWVGWFGFNAGSSFAAGAQAAEAIMNTHASACCSALVWLYMSQRNDESGSKPSYIAVMNGSIAGLAAITPAAGAPCDSFEVACLLKAYVLLFMLAPDCNYQLQATWASVPP